MTNDVKDKRPPSLSVEEVSRRTGASPEQIREWRSLGFLGAAGKEGFTLEDVELVRLIQLCLERGFDAQAITEAGKQEEGFLGHYLAQLFPDGIAPTYSLAESAAMAGLDEAVVRRLWEALGSGGKGERMSAEDVEVLRGWTIALGAGLPEEALLQLVRVYADALGRVAEAEARLFHFYVHDRLRDTGLSGSKLFETTQAAAQPMRALIEPAVLYFHRKGMERALREDMLMHLAEHVTPSETTDTPGQLRLAIVFVDLASFTPLTESMGDAAAAQVVERFSELVREVVNKRHGRVVERIGDAFLMVFPEPRSAVACALEIDKRTAAESQFPAVRGGIHLGTVLYREGGYVGSNVNIASRVASEARRRQILVTAAVRKEASGLPGVEFVAIGKRRLKGLGDEVELFEARAHDVRSARKAIDPVCGMELTSAGIAARLTREGSERVFCSENCLRMFVEAPTKYGG